MNSKAKKSTQATPKLPAITPTKVTTNRTTNKVANTVNNKIEKPIPSQANKINTRPNAAPSSTKLPMISSPKEKSTSAISNSSIDTSQAKIKTDQNDIEVNESIIIPSEHSTTDQNMMEMLAVTNLVITPPEPTTPPNLNKNGDNGDVTLIYEQYNEIFPIVSGSTTHANIDDVYALTFVMPNCRIHLSEYNPVDKRKMEIENQPNIFIFEEPIGIYHGLLKDKIYYVYVEQEADQLAKDQAKTRDLLADVINSNKKSTDIIRDDGRVMESCSCLYGNPCVDEYGCKDWDNRNAIATKNGWKGF